MFYQFFIFSFISVAIIYSLLASLTDVFYKNKSISELSILEKQILNNKATVGVRVSVFFINLLGSLVAPHIWILAGIVAIIVYLIGLFV